MNINQTATPEFNQLSIRAIAVFEALKGLLMLGLVLCFIFLFQSNPTTMAKVLIDDFNFDSAGHYPQALLMLSRTLTNIQISIAITCAFLYSLIKISEAYGLWHLHNWGRLLGILSIGVLIPYELYEMLHQYSITKLVIFCLNVAIVSFLLFKFKRTSKAISGQ